MCMLCFLVMSRGNIHASRDMRFPSYHVLYKAYAAEVCTPYIYIYIYIYIYLKCVCMHACCCSWLVMSQGNIYAFPQEHISLNVGFTFLLHGPHPVSAIHNDFYTHHHWLLEFSSWLSTNCENLCMFSP